MEEIDDHPAVLVFIGILGRNTADANNLGIEREVGRSMLSVKSVVTFRGSDLALPKAVALPTQQQGR